MNNTACRVSIRASSCRLLAVAIFFSASLPVRSQSDPVYSWANFVGQPGGSGSADGPGNVARFNSPTGVAVDNTGNVYIADQQNNTIRRMTMSGTNWVVTTVAGSPGGGGGADGTNNAAQFNKPTGVAVDSSGNVFVVDYWSPILRKVAPVGTNWVVTTIPGYLFNASGVAVDGAGNVYGASTMEHTIKKFTPVGTNWVETIIAGSTLNIGSADGTNNAARFYHPTGVALDNLGNLYVADCWNYTIRKITPVGGNWVVTTLAGSVRITGSADGTNNAAQFNQPTGLTVDSSGNLYVADQVNSTIRKVTPVGTNWVVTTVAGSPGVAGSIDGTNSLALFNTPSAVAADSTGNLFVADVGNHLIRKITLVGTNWAVTTIAGSMVATGKVDGAASNARFYYPYCIAVGNTGNLFVGDWANHTIRKVTPSGQVTTIAGSAGTAGSANGTNSVARFNNPRGVACDNDETIFVADSKNNTIRKMTPAGTNWVVSTIAGSAGITGGTDGTNDTARFRYPAAVVVASPGVLFVADYYNYTIRQVTAVGTNWVVTTIAGSVGVSGSADGTNSAALFNKPSGVAVDSAGIVYVGDEGNNAVRRLTPVGTNWVVTTMAGGSYGSADGIGNAAQFIALSGVEVDAAGNVYVADQWNCTIRKVTSAGVVTTIGGFPRFAGGADGIGSSAKFAYPTDVGIDSAGNLYVADAANNRISKGMPFHPPTITTTSPLSDGMVSTAYSHILTAIGGATPYGWSVVSNNLPAGLNLDAGSGAITGTPSVDTVANFRVRVTGSDAFYSEQDFSLTITVAPADSVGDGITDAWRAQYFHDVDPTGATTNSRSCATCDADGDGQNNRQEFLLGSNPTNSASGFRITSILPAGDDLTITWQTVGGKINVVQTNSVCSTNFADLSGPITITGTGDTSTNYVDFGGATNRPARFYRIRLAP